MTPTATALDESSDFSDQLSAELAAEAVAANGWAVAPNFLPADLAERLEAECREHWAHDAFRRAGVGRGTALQIREDIRRDHVLWLEPGLLTPAQAGYLGVLDTLRLAINRRLFLGLFDFEGHFAVYPEGGFYKRHLDRHAKTADRAVTAILYLNRDWHPDDGGQLKIELAPGGDPDGPSTLVSPEFNTLVAFLSGDYWHEVLPARRERASITGWFRVRAV